MMDLQIIELAGEPDLLPVRAVEAIQKADAVILQSERTECAEELAKWNKNRITLDSLFEEAEDFDALYAAGAQQIIREMEQENRTVFCILGNAGTNGFVRELARRSVKMEYISCGGATAAAIAAARRCFEIAEYSVLDARSLGEAVFDTSAALVIDGLDNTYCAENVKCVLSDYYAEETEGLLYAGGTARRVRLYDLDRDVSLGTGGVFVLPAVSLYQKERYGLYDLVRIMKVLRGENGCPWDREQTHESLRQYMLEEAYEAVDAIDADDICALYDELGDVFLQVVFHAEVARECGEFDIDDVATAVCKKMIHRHPHIFGNGKAATAQEVITNWEAIKRREKNNEDFASVLRDVPRSMGAMMRAYKLQKKAASIGFDWKDAEAALPKVEEELAEWKAELCSGQNDAMEGEAGDLLFAVINVLRLKKTNPELCLNKTCEKFIARMESMERNAGRELAGMTLAELDELWERAKREKADKIGKNAENMG